MPALLLKRNSFCLTGFHCWKIKLPPRSSSSLDFSCFTSCVGLAGIVRLLRYYLPICYWWKTYGVCPLKSREKSCFWAPKGWRSWGPYRWAAQQIRIPFITTLWKSLVNSLKSLPKTASPFIPFTATKKKLNWHCSVLPLRYIIILLAKFMQKQPKFFFQQTHTCPLTKRLTDAKKNSSWTGRNITAWLDLSNSGRENEFLAKYVDAWKNVTTKPCSTN